MWAMQFRNGILFVLYVFRECGTKILKAYMYFIIYYTERKIPLKI